MRGNEGNREGDGENESPDVALIGDIHTLAAAMEGHTTGQLINVVNSSRVSQSL